MSTFGTQNWVATSLLQNRKILNLIKGSFMTPTTAHSTRLYTAQSRPATARPTTAASTRYDGSEIVAVLEGRGIAREVGIASLDKDTGHVTLVQVCSRRIYL